MLWLKIFCWAYLIFTALGRIANYDKCSPEHNKTRVIDNVMIAVLVVLLIALYTLRI